MALTDAQRTPTIETDVAVIGAGTAGLSAYRAAKAAGRRALLIESGPYGTTCARVGCMPSKLLIAAADAAHAATRFPALGLAASAVRIDGRAVMARVRRERDRFVGFVSEGVDGIPPADKLRGVASFVDDSTLSVDGHANVRARAIVIATGSLPDYPAAWRELGNRVVTSDDVFEWQDLPRRVAVFGPGVIGLELGQALHRLGVRVKVFGRGGGVGPLTDTALVDYARRTFAAEFPLETDAPASVAREGDELVVTARGPGGEAVHERFDFVLAATGRRPNLDALGLARTSLALHPNGVPVFDRHTLQCGTSPVFIAGDANGDVPLLHEAADEGRIAGENAARYPDVTAGPRRTLLGIVFTDPQMCVVGAPAAALTQCDHVVGEVSFENQGRSRIMLRNQGLLHVYAEIATGRFLGAEMIGPDAEHIGHLLAWCRQMRLSIAQMLDFPFYHPVVEEGLRTALRDALGKLRNVSVEQPKECEVSA
jgi:dihydrolipoamide dehydrogenase